jgi:hypothetical protein
LQNLYREMSLIGVIPGRAGPDNVANTAFAVLDSGLASFARAPE